MPESPLDDAARRIVEQEVHACQSSLVDDLLKNETYSYDDIVNLEHFRVQLHGGEEHMSLKQREVMIEQLEASRDALQEEIDDLDDKIAEWESDDEDTDVLEKQLRHKEERMEHIEHDIEALENAEQEMQEVFEWWIVSPWLREKLEAHGEPILDNDHGVWWGRCTTGQMICMDGVIRDIAREVLHV